MVLEDLYGEQAFELANDEGDRLRLRMWANSWLVQCASSGVRSLRTSSVDAFYGDADIIDQLLEFQKRPRFHLG